MRSSRGSTTLEIAILAPALFALIFTVVQVGVWAYGQQIASAAAARGASVGAAYESSPRSGERHARDFVAATAGDSMSQVEVTSSATADVIRIDVRARSLSVLPGLPGLPIHADAVQPRERFTSSVQP